MPVVICKIVCLCVPMLRSSLFLLVILHIGGIIRGTVTSTSMYMHAARTLTGVGYLYDCESKHTNERCMEYCTLTVGLNQQ